jgi:hypothetical protein
MNRRASAADLSRRNGARFFDSEGESTGPTPEPFGIVTQAGEQIMTQADEPLITQAGT